MVFPVVIHGCEAWTLKKAECWSIHAFEMWCCRRLLRVPRTARRPKQSILKEISPEYSLERLMLKLKLKYSGHLMQRTDSLEMTLNQEKIEGRRRRGRQRMRCWIASLTQWTSLRSSRSWWWTGRPGVHLLCLRAELTGRTPLDVTSVLSGNHLLHILQEWGKALVGTVGSRTWASSLCRVPHYINELRPVVLLGAPSKQNFQDIPWRLMVELPSPKLTDLAQPHSSGSLPLPPRQLPADREETPSLRLGFIGVFLLGDFYLLDIKVHQYCAIFFIKLNVTHESMEWRTLSDLLYVIGCRVMG